MSEASPAKDSGNRSGDDFFHNAAMNIGQPKISAAVPECKLLVIQPQKVEQSRVQVMDVDFVFHGGKSKVIGGSVSHSTASSPASKPH